MKWLLPILVLPYFVLLLKIFRNLLNIESFESTTDSAIFVSIVVACHNEEESVSRLLRHLADQDYPGILFEVIIVDDNSADKTSDIASGFNNIFNLTVARNNGTGKKAALRTGIEAAAATLIITTDADCIMGKKWIRIITSYFGKHRPEMIICPVQLESKPGFFGIFQELEFLSLQGITAGSVISGNACLCNGANLCFTKDAYFRNKNNLHNEIASGDDIFLLHSLKRDKTAKIIWLESSESLVTAGSSQKISSFLNQRARWLMKGKAYSDSFTLTLAIVTFVTIIVFAISLFAGFFAPEFLLVFISVLLLKSVPDFLILSNTSERYGRKELMKWFLPVQIIYPFYVFSVMFYSLFKKRRW